MAIGRFLKNLILNRRPVPLDAQEIARQEELRHAVAALPSLDDQHPESAAAADWLGNRRRLRQLIATADPRRFLEWDVIAKTMFIGNAPHIPTELASLKASPDWSRRWKPALQEDAAGCPRRLRWHLGSSGNLVQHADNFFQAEAMLGKTVDQFSRIVEFGGGYGSAARLAWRLGFRGRYIIFDLPEFAALQRYFLKSVGIPIAPSPDAPGVQFLSDVDDLKIQAAAGEGLFVAMWSISETPLNFRQQILAAVAGLSHFFIAYQDVFGEINNVEFFHQWMATQLNYDWSERRIAHLPTANSYLAGAAKSAGGLR